MENININYESLIKTISSMPPQAQRAFFLTACLNKDLNLCQACVDAKVDMKIGDEYGQPFFIDYVKDKRAKTHVVYWLISRGLDINYHSDVHFSPLKAACAKCNRKMVKVLLDKKAKFTSVEGRTNYEGEIYCTLVNHTADETVKYQIVKLLLESGAPLNVDDASANNPLYMSINYKYGVEFVKLFLQYGVSANLVVYGVSMLSLAVSKGNYDTAKVLLENGADVNQKLINLAYTKEYKGALTAMDIAISNGDESMQALLQEYGGIASTKQEKLNYLCKCKDDKEVVEIIQKMVAEEQVC